MKRIKVSNKGEVENGAFALLGASTKEGQDKIGFFGSGNKYAIATLLRKEIPFRIFSGETEMLVTTVPTSFGGQTYNQIYIDGVPTSFTTRMGPTWDAWFALREIICNAIDEGAHRVDFIESCEEVKGEAGVTTIYVDLISDLMLFETEYDKYFLQEEHLSKADTPYGVVSCYPASKDNIFVAFRKNIRATALSDTRKSLFRYSFDSIEINESRIIQSEYQMHERIAYFLSRCDNVDIIRTYLANAENTNFFEYCLLWNYISIDLNRAWRKAIDDCAIIPRSLVESFTAEELQGTYTVPDSLAKAIAEAYPDVIVYGSENKTYELIEADDNQRELAYRAVAEVDSFGLSLSGFKVEFAKFYRPNIVAHCDRKTSTIRLSIEHMDDYDELVSTVYEELSHIQGLRDCTREFEQHLMRELVKAKRRVVELEAIVRTIGR